MLLPEPRHALRGEIAGNFGYVPPTRRLTSPRCAGQQYTLQGALLPFRANPGRRPVSNGGLRPVYGLMHADPEPVVGHIRGICNLGCNGWRHAPARVHATVLLTRKSVTPKMKKSDAMQ